jgi:hypothetical protein
MKNALPILLLLAISCTPPKHLHKASYEGVEVAYHWNHRKDKPSELILRMENRSLEDKRISLVIDLYLEGKTVETLEADTCIKVGRTMNGKLNGIFFTPERVTTAQIKAGEVQVEMTRTFVEPLRCP